MNNTKLTKGKKLYYARILPSANVYDVCDLTIRTVAETYFVGIDKHDKHAYLFSYDDINKSLFTNRNEALEKVLIAEDNRAVITEETEKYYEEY